MSDTRPVRGIALLALRQVTTLVMSSVCAVFLARWLDVRDFGLFAQIHFFVVGAAVMLVGDLGVATALVRRPDEPPTELWGAALRLFNGLALTALVVGGAVGLALVAVGRSQTGVMTVVLAAALAARFVRQIPSARLARAQRFSSLALCELVEMSAYYAVALGLAASGAGPWAFVAAVATKEALGAAALRVAAGAPPGRSAPLRHLREVVRFGFQHQLTGILTGSTDAFPPIVIAAVVGSTQFGLVAWSYSLILIPIVFLSSLDRAMLPVLASVQRSAAALAHRVEATVRYSALLGVAAATVLVVTAPQLVAVVYGDKWAAAVPLLRWFSVSIAATTSMTPIIVACGAIGRTEIPLRLAGAWSVLTWTVGFAVVQIWGTRGYGPFYAAMQVTYLPIAIIGVRLLHIDLARTLAPAVAGAVAAAAVGLLLPSDGSWLWLLVRVGAMLAVFGISAVSVDVGRMRRDWRLLWHGLALRRQRDGIAAGA